MNSIYGLFLLLKSQAHALGLVVGFVEFCGRV